MYVVHFVPTKKQMGKPTRIHDTVRYIQNNIDKSVVRAEPALRTVGWRILAVCPLLRAAAVECVDGFRLLAPYATSGEMQREEGGVSACEASETMDFEGSHRRHNSGEFSTSLSIILFLSSHAARPG